MDNKLIQILLIEDSTFATRHTKKMLDDAKSALFATELKCAERLSKGLEYLVKGGIDIVLLDLTLPDSNEMETFTSVHTQNPDIPVVVISGIEDETLAIQAVKQGAQDYLVKGRLSSDTLKRSILYALERKKTELQIQKLNRKLKGNLQKLEVANTEYKKIQAELKLLNQKLEEMVKKRTKKIVQLNQILRAIRNVNQFIVKEKDPHRLLHGICNNLIKNRGYENSWIAVLDESGKYVMTAEGGLGKNFLPLAKGLKKGKIPNCGQKALAKSGVVVIKETISTCSGCPLAGKDECSNVMAIRLEHARKIYGFLTVCPSRESTVDKEEIDLFEEVAGDIAYALYNIEAEKRKEKLFHDIGERVKELECIYGITKAIQENVNLDDLFKTAAKLLPPGWHYPEITRGKIRFDGKKYVSEPFKETAWKQSSDIIVKGKLCGSVEVYYTEERPELDEGPFLKEECDLINGIAHILGEAIEHKQSEAKFRGIFESEMLSVLFWDANGEITEANDAFLKLVGYSREDLRTGELRWKDLTPPEYIKADEEKLAELADRGVMAPFEKEYIHKSGRRIPVVISAATLWGAKTSGVAIIMDITNRKKAENEILKLNKELEQRVKDRTEELQRTVNLMAGREVRMAELKEVIQKLRGQLESAGMTPMTDDPLKAGGTSSEKEQM
jgi:PAS domain S-box-containing protein